MNSEDRSRLTAAFPRGMHAELDAVLRRLPSALYPVGPPIIEALVAGEHVAIPQRVYFKPDPAPSALSAIEREIWHCVYSRHHDGHVREAALRALLERPIQPWVAPFVLQLVGEYVVEIILPMLDAGLEQQQAVLEFVAENDEFLARVESRAISYWNEYYRSYKRTPTAQHRWYAKENSPALVLLSRLANATTS